jgi:hypothetical protein
MSDRYVRDGSKSWADVIVCFDRENQNWVVFWHGSKILEFTTGEPFVKSRVEKHLWKIKNGRLRDALKEAKDLKEHNKQKIKEDIKYASRSLAKDMYDYSKAPIEITSRDGQRKLTINPGGKKHFQIAGG